MNYRPTVAYAAYFIHVLFDVCCRVCGATAECSDGRTHAAHSKNIRAGTASTLQPIQQTGEASCHRQPHDKVSAETVARVVTGIPRSCRLHFGISCVCNQGCMIMMILALWSRRCHGEEYPSTSGQYIDCG